MPTSLSRQVFITVLAAAIPVACAQNAPMPVAQSPAIAQGHAHEFPPSCKGQSSTSLYATTPATPLKPHPAFLCIPAFGGFSGSLEYPAAKPPVNESATSSTTDYNHMLPTLRKGGRPIFYLQLMLSGPTSFAKAIEPGGGLTSKAFLVGRSYDVYGEAKLNSAAGITIPFLPCVETAALGKYGGVLENIGTVLRSQSLTSSGTIYIEVYRNAGVTAPC